MHLSDYRCVPIEDIFTMNKHSLFKLYIKAELGDDCSIREVVCANIQNVVCDSAICKCSSGYSASTTSTCNPVGKCSFNHFDFS